MSKRPLAKRLSVRGAPSAEASHSWGMVPPVSYSTCIRTTSFPPSPSLPSLAMSKFSPLPSDPGKDQSALYILVMWRWSGSVLIVNGAEKWQPGKRQVLGLARGGWADRGDLAAAPGPREDGAKSGSKVLGLCGELGNGCLPTAGGRAQFRPPNRAISARAPAQAFPSWLLCTLLVSSPQVFPFIPLSGRRGEESGCSQASVSSWAPQDRLRELHAGLLGETNPHPVGK